MERILTYADAIREATEQEMDRDPSVIVLGLGVNYALAWTGPTTAPPNSNLSAPINTSSQSQVKSGAFGGSGLLAAYGGIDMSSQRITSLAAPVAATDAATKAYVDAASGGVTHHKQVFTSSGTWMQPLGVTSVYISMAGGGGGGSGGSQQSASNYFGWLTGPGGGSGGDILFTNVAVTGNVTVTVGAGGAGGTYSNSGGILPAGGNGGSSLFGSVTATGGGGGGGAGSPGGSTGSDGCYFTSDSIVELRCSGGNGGSSYFGIGGAGGAGHGGSGGGYGSGGGGGYYGGAGAGGIVIVEWDQ